MNKIRDFHKHNNSSLLIDLLIILLVVLFCLFLMKDDYKIPNQNPDNHRVQASSAKSNQDLVETTQIVQSIEIPILMYHHVRDFDDPNDQIGTNLSVSVSDFSDELDFIKSNGYNAINFIDLANGNIPINPIILTFDDGYDNFYANAYPLLKSKSMTAVTYVIVDSIGKTGYMTESNIVDLSQNGIEIGSHTLSHPNLTGLSESKLNTEVVESKKILETLISSKIYSICYPAGKYNEATETAVKNAGYLYAVTTERGRANINSPMSLKRYRVNKDTDISSFIKK